MKPSVSTILTISKYVSRYLRRCYKLSLLIILLLTLTINSKGQDLCGGAAVVVPGATCASPGNNVAGVLNAGATWTAIASPCVGSNNVRDIWFRFTATTTYVTVNLTITAGSTNTRFQVYTSASCGGVVTSLFCSGGLTGVVTGLTVGQQYLIRVYNAANSSFNVCVLTPPANDFCSSPIALSNTFTCNNTSVTLTGGATYTSNAVLDACNNTDNDIWYSFVAHSASANVALTGAPAGTRVQVVSNDCGGTFTQLYCGAGGTFNGLTPGTTYLVRVYNQTNLTGTFNLCVTDQPPANNACAGRITLTSSTVCTPTTGTLYAATNEAVVATAPCAGSIFSDVWYQFVAQSSNPTITLSNIAASITSPGFQLFTANCTTPVSWGCGVPSGSNVVFTASNLNIGTTYYIRVYQAAGTMPAWNNASFDICITDPVVTPPINDDCAGAIMLPVAGGCSNVLGTVAGSTVSPIALPGPCGTLGYDVWYKFIAVNNSINITLNPTPGSNNFTNARVQILSGTCAGFTSLACGASPQSAAGLTPGNTYYVRVYSLTGPAANGNANFNVCAQATAPPPRYGKGYVNISKRSTGGVVQPGDTLEIRMTINHTSGIVYSPRYLDNLPTNTRIDSSTPLRIITNEGLMVKQFTLNANDDEGSFLLSPPVNQYNIRMNIGFAGFPGSATVNNTATETATATGQMNSTNFPRGGGTLLFATSYRVIVTGNVGDTITLFPSQFIYKRNSTSDPDEMLTASPYRILISDPLSLCANATGVNNAQESGGTFGSGTPLNRSYDLDFPIPGYTYMPNVSSIAGLGDGRYSIVKNISPYSSTIRTADRTPTCPTAMPSEQSCTNRMHGGHWDVDGDHTGTTNSIGNAPPSHSTPGGYMLMVNADYVASETFRQTINNLCPNTYYEFSAWFRNICPTCGVDSLGSNYLPRQPGVLPNLTFEMDGIDRYSTGGIDTGGWVKKGFVFRTGNNQNTITFAIRNNAQGGGGNDWVMDDISIATCLPNMQYSPSLNPTVCENNAFTLHDTIRSYFNNYSHHQWQMSTDGGVTWTDLGAARDSTPVFNPSINAWEYVTTYNIPPSGTTMADSGNLYRVLVATTSDNLSNPNCRVTDGISFINLDIQNCGIPLKTELLSFSGKLVSAMANLTWTTSKEEEPVMFEVQRSANGSNFVTIGTVAAHNNASALNTYHFTDPEMVTGQAYYRIAMVNPGNKRTYSRIILLSIKNTKNFELTSVINPFYDQLEFNVSTPRAGKVDVQLTDMAGNIVRKNSFILADGINSLKIANTAQLPAGMYVLHVMHDNQIVTRKVSKNK